MSLIFIKSPLTVRNTNFESRPHSQNLPKIRSWNPHNSRRKNLWRSFTQNVEELKEFISLIEADGGRDFPEDLTGGLEFPKETVDISKQDSFDEVDINKAFDPVPSLLNLKVKEPSGLVEVNGPGIVVPQYAPGNPPGTLPAGFVLEYCGADVEFPL